MNNLGSIKKAADFLVALLKRPIVLLAILVYVPLMPSVSAEETKSSAAAANETQNPVAAIISVPFESYFYFNAGPNHATIYDLNIEPVIPFHLSEDWNIITRTIIPTLNQPALFSGSRSVAGVGDINPSLYLSPVKPWGGIIWGAGPTFTLPTASDSLLGKQKWSLGPSAAALTIKGPWLIGGLIYNQWSVAGWGKNNVNGMLIEPFVYYNFPKGWYLSTAPLMTADWEATSGQRWTVPVGGGIGRLVRIGKVPTDFTLQAYSNVEHPQFAPNWELRFQVQIVLPSF